MTLNIRIIPTLGFYLGYLFYISSFVFQTMENLLFIQLVLTKDQMDNLRKIISEIFTF